MRKLARHINTSIYESLTKRIEAYTEVLRLETDPDRAARALHSVVELAENIRDEANVTAMQCEKGFLDG